MKRNLNQMKRNLNQMKRNLNKIQNQNYLITDECKA